MKHILVLTLTLSLAIGAAGPACRRAAVPDDHEHAGEAHEHHEHEEGEPGTVRLTPEAVTGGGIVVEPALSSEVAQTVAALGEIEFDARRVAGAAARSSGRIERVTAFTGDRVQAGGTLAEIYSQDFLAAQTEVLQAAARAARLAGRPDEAAAKAFLEAARRKLAPYGPTPAEIDALVASGEPRPLLAVRAPIGGLVIESRAVPGSAVAEGTDLFTIADPSTVWACVHLTEQALASVKPGMEATIRARAYPGREFRGRLTLVGATMDAATRTVEGRVVLPNPDGLLKPGMFVEAALNSAERRTVLTVPAAAVQEFNSGRIVFVQTAPGIFVVRPVETGGAFGGRIEIRFGLAAGDEVAAAGSFILKSELMKASLRDEHGHD